MYANRLTISFANIHKIVIGCSRKRYYLSFINKIHIIMTGKDLKNKLETTNYSISEIAKGIGMSQPALFNKFSNDTISSTLLERIAKFLQVPIDWFYKGTEFANKEQDNKPGGIFAYYQAIIDEKDKQIAKILDILNGKGEKF